MARALLLGGTGLIGRAVARRLLADGWQVDATGRDAAHVPADLAEHPGFSFLRSQRCEPSELRRAVGGGAELLVDLLCASEDDALVLSRHLGDVESTVMLSSKAVYVDEFGRHGNSLQPPVFPLPVREVDPTVVAGRGDPDSREGYGEAKIAAENTLLDSGAPVTVLRAGKVHGDGATRPREWAFLARALARREQLALAHGGRGGDQTAAAANIAALVATVAAQPGARILNAADPDAPTGLEIARAVAAHVGHRFDEVLLDDDVDPAYGTHPWDLVPPMVLDTSEAQALGWTPAGSYAETVGVELDWLRRQHELGLTDGYADDRWFARFLDFRTEDAYLLLRSLSGS